MVADCFINSFVTMYTNKNKNCLKEACQKIATKRGYCSGHYAVALHQGKFNVTGQICNIDGCKKLTFGESQICWNHCRSQHKEGSKRWLKIKENTDLYKRSRINAKKYKTKIRSIPSNVQKLRITAKKWYWQNRDRVLANLYKSRARLSKEQRYFYNQKRNARNHFGGWENREAVIKRDGDKCTQCGISREEHKQKWHQDLHVNHIDDYGRNLIRKAQNNSLDNLETLCVRCHASKTKHRNELDQKRQELLLYGYDFSDKLKEQVRARDNRHCQDCQISERTLRKRLSIHHLNGDKKMNDLENLVALCPKCHYKRHIKK